MSEPGQIELADALPVASDVNAAIADLRAAGAERFDPVRLHYIEALARRTTTHHGNVRRVLEARLAQALEQFKDRFALAQREAAEAVAQSADHYPQSASDLQRLVAEGDFKGLRSLIAALQTSEQSTSLRALVRQLEQQAQGHADAHVEGHTGARPELKAIRNHRDTWSKLSVDKQVVQALQQAPKNAGPINSHMLVLRSLALMREISPDYLNRFMSYADTLLSLEQGERERAGNPKKLQSARVGRK